MWWENQARNFPDYRKINEGLAGKTMDFQKINKQLPCWKLAYYLASATLWAKAVTRKKVKEVFLVF